MENKFKEARKFMFDTIESDPAIKQGYVQNISMFFYDNFFSQSHKLEKPEYRDKLAEALLNKLLGS